ncbi:hypothetical protein BLA24064_04816 [Burkholderia latens]|uniref:Uncharacterized protein n=1 Tax=Burkholderia latens TaxID=488446 RepID=A0A6P2P2A0_9BURK|nr:hypothetical protein BLA24064_04816 [Burkholderia latens]
MASIIGATCERVAAFIGRVIPRRMIPGGRSGRAANGRIVHRASRSGDRRSVRQPNAAARDAFAVQRLRGRKRPGGCARNRYAIRVSTRKRFRFGPPHVANVARQRQQWPQWPHTGRPNSLS